QRSAEEFADFGADVPDTVILNSVVQYFPSLDYLMQVLKKAAESIAPGGHIFLGDIRNHTLLEEFQSFVQLSQSSPTTERSRLRQRVEQVVTEEDELLIDPTFFFALRETLPQITGVEVQLKRGRNRNELTQFRYDVVLHVGEERAQPAEVAWKDWT